MIDRKRITISGNVEAGELPSLYMLGMRESCYEIASAFHTLYCWICVHV